MSLPSHCLAVMIAGVRSQVTELESEQLRLLTFDGQQYLGVCQRFLCPFVK